jgi:hypothetical protein
MRATRLPCIPVLILALATASSAAAAQRFYVVGVSGADSVMAVSLEQVMTSADGHKVVPVHVISWDETIDTTVLEVDCAARRRRVISETLLTDGSEAIDKTTQNDRSWQAYGSDAPADELACAAPGAPTAVKGYQAADLKDFAVRAARTLRSLQADAEK